VAGAVYVTGFAVELDSVPQVFPLQFVPERLHVTPVLVVPVTTARNIAVRLNCTLKLMGMIETPTAGGGGCVPVPLRVTLCGLPVALSVTVIVPAKAPVVTGVKVTLITQLTPTARLAPQVLTCPKFWLATMLVMLIDAFPVFVSVAA